jgi:hypothetical protein
MAVGRELARYRLYTMGVHVVSWNKLGTVKRWVLSFVWKITSKYSDYFYNF